MKEGYQSMAFCSAPPRFVAAQRQLRSSLYLIACFHHLFFRHGGGSPIVSNVPFASDNVFVLLKRFRVVESDCVLFANDDDAT